MFLDPRLNASYPLLAKLSDPLKKAEREIVGREHEKMQLLASMSRPELCNALLLAEAGTGKGHPLDTLLPVADGRGYVKVGDLVVGDQVFDENGQPVTITGLFPQGLKRAYKVGFADGTSVITNDEHLWNVRTKHGRYVDGPYQTKELRELVAAGLTDTQGFNKWSVLVGQPVNRDAVALPLNPYALGALLGGGALTARAGRASGGPLTISSNDEAVVVRVAEALGAVGVVRNEHNYSWLFLRRDPYVSSRGCEVTYIQLSDVTDFALDTVFGRRSVDRRIPENYLTASIEQRFELLRGLMDTEGSVTGNDRLRCAFSTNGRGLARDVRELLNSLGIRSTLETRTRDGHEEYALHLKLADEDKSNVFWLPRHQDKIDEHRRDDRKFNEHYDDLLIVAVEDLGYETEMTCLMVDGESHLYQVGEEHIVTHNTALVQATMLSDKDRLYLEVDPARMVAEAGDGDLMASALKGFFDEAESYVKSEQQELVLFIDEFHQIIQLSAAAVEAIKPVLAASGTRGIRIIAATTYDEFHKHIGPNQPLVERLQRINLAPPDEDTTIEILQGMAVRYGVSDEFYDDHIFRQIYEYTQRYMPASAQPRKSILVLDSMVGWHRLTKRTMDREMLSDVLMESLNVNVAFRVDGAKIKRQLDAKVFSQDLATSAVARRLQLSVADLNDKGRPEASMLLTGSTGVGKATTVSTEIPVWTDDGSVAWKKAADLVPGDRTFTRRGTPQEVLGVFPQGEREVYRVTLGDGRTLDVSDNHLWAVYPNRQSRQEGPTIYTTQTLLNKGLLSKLNNGRQGMKYVVPMNEAVQWPERDLAVHPYVMGAAIGDGCLRPTHDRAFHISSADEELVARVAGLLGAEHVRNEHNFGWGFRLPEPRRVRRGRWPGSQAVIEYLQIEDIVGDFPEVFNKTSEHKRIPEPYMTASIEQRWELVRGLFDTDGSIGQADGDRYNVSYSTTSEGLVHDVQRLLYSLGVSSTIGTSVREGKGLTEHIVRVKSRNANKERFFALTRKREIARRAAGMNKHREKTFDYVGIRSIERLGYTELMVCIYVDDDEHLYQAGDFVVTHNTELTKQLARLLFGDDQRHLIRFDMTEYAHDASFASFRSELTRRVWDLSHAVLLFDEIEKASPMVTRVLLQVLDDGRLSDDNNREVSFLNTYIVLTTNAGSEIYKHIAQYAADDTGSGKQLTDYKKLIRRSISDTSADNRFPPELLGRIDAIVPFQPLSLPTQEKIVRVKLRTLIQEVLIKHNVRITVDKKVLRYLIEDKGDTDSDAGGARTAVAKMTDEVTTSVATFINENPVERRIRVDVVGELVSDDKERLRSDAYIEVSAVR